MGEGIADILLDEGGDETDYETLISRSHTNEAALEESNSMSFVLIRVIGVLTYV